MALKTASFFLTLLISSTVLGSDTLYFRLSNPWNTVKSPTGKYLRKCIKENDYYHVWDYNSNNIMVTESFYSDTNFTKKLFCHKYFNETNGILQQSRCYENGRLHGYFVGYDSQGDTTSYQVYENGAVVKEWNSNQNDKGVVFDKLEKTAKFPGGQSSWLKYLSDNLVYPNELKQQNISGQVLARIHIDATGEVKKVEILKSLHPLLDKEVIRVIMKSPKWKPAKQNGKNVPMYISQPVTF